MARSGAAGQGGRDRGAGAPGSRRSRSAATGGQGPVDPERGRGAHAGRGSGSPDRGPTGREREALSLPRQLLAAAALVAAEGAVTVAYALYLAVRALVDDPTESVAGVEIGALLVLGLGMLLLAAARGVLRLRGWTRGPVTTVQLLLLLTALSFLPAGGAGYAAAGAAAGLLAVTVLVLLFSPRARAAFDAEAGRGADPVA